MVVHARPDRGGEGTARSGRPTRWGDFSIRAAEMGGGVPPDMAERIVSGVAQARREISPATGYARVDRVQPDRRR